MPRPARIFPVLSEGVLEGLRARLLKYTMRDHQTGCLIWTGAKRGKYGHITIKHVSYAAHRVAFELTGKALKPHDSVCHSCDNTLCIEPSHLFVGTHTDNMRDMMLKGRNRSFLRPEQVSEIRARYAAGEKQKDIAASIGINQPTVSMIVRRKVWEFVS